MSGCSPAMFLTGLSLLFSALPVVNAFGVQSKVITTFRSTTAHHEILPSTHKLGLKVRASTVLSLAQSSSEDDTEPHAISSGYSQSQDLINAITEATESALSNLPPGSGDEVQIDLGIVYVSSLYDGQTQPSSVVPCVLDVCNRHYGVEGREVVQKLIGCYAGGLVGSKSIVGTEAKREANSGKACLPMESEGTHGVVVTLCVLPDTKLKTFHVVGDDVPDDIGRISPDTWKNAVGLRGFDSDREKDSPTVMLLPSPAFQNDLDEFLRGATMAFGPSATIFGGLASTVSSLSRARLFRFDVDEPYCMQTLGDGCIGVAMSGDVQAKVMVAQGTKPVGGVYRVVAGQDSTITAIQLDEVATEQLNADMDVVDGDDDDDDDDTESSAEEEMDTKQKAAAAYAKAVIPKPVLAEANFLMKTLSDDEQSFMRKSLLVGLERSGGTAKTANELIRLAQGQGHLFTVRQVASAGMQDGSITFPLGSVDIEKGSRLRFFVRDGDFSKKEVEAIWMGYKKKLFKQLMVDEDEDIFTPSACLLFPTLDRGTKIFGGKSGYESSSISEFLPTIPTITGFFANGVIGKLGEDDPQVMVHGSASCYALIGPKSNRPIYSATQAAAEAAKNKGLESEAEEKTESDSTAEMGDDELSTSTKDLIENIDDQPAPRSENGELILKRREIHSGRALTVSAVEWSVVENIASPTSALEGYMWDKETEVDRLRERYPLSNIVSQCNLANLDPKQPSPRDWISPVKLALEESSFVIIPEIKRLEPVSGSLRKRYDVSKISNRLTLSGAPVLSINCDGVLFGGGIDDVTLVREISSKSAAEKEIVAPPILGSDLILYPYQLYKLRLAGADAATILVGALTSKDLLYLTKIAITLKMQIIASVTSDVQIQAMTKLSPGSIAALVVSNRNLETFEFDESGEQALNLLQGDAMKEFKNSHNDVTVLAEGRVGIIKRDGSPKNYISALKKAGAMGAIVGGAIAIDSGSKSYELLRSEC